MKQESEQQQAMLLKARDKLKQTLQENETLKADKEAVKEENIRLKKLLADIANLALDKTDKVEKTEKVEKVTIEDCPPGDA
jgi:hypothetical protein